MLQDNLFPLIIFIIFSLCGAIQLFYYFYFYLAVYTKKEKELRVMNSPVSVIICARNEAENLEKFLPLVLRQDYHDFEVIVVNDCSEDNSYAVLGKLLAEYPHLKVSNVNKDPKFTHNKKFAQFIGIKAAKNDILVFTDADCRPESDQWLKGMVSKMSPETSFVLGYGGYMPAGGMLNRYIRYDCLTIAMQYLGMAIKGIPYMGVGRNLVYRRSVFFENKGFGLFNHIISGDDDLFVNSNAGKLNTRTEYGPETHTRSLPCTTFSEWAMQKKRHLTTAPYYKLRDKLLLIAEPITRTLFYISFIILLSFLFLWPWVLAIFLVRLIVLTTAIALTAKKLNEPSITGFSIIFDIFSPLINGTMLLINTFKRPGKYQWK
jgi:poly-beta-1,6-N-acetyl-D-glucosamine synthase